MTGWVWIVAEIVAAVGVGLAVTVSGIYLRLRQQSPGMLPRALATVSALFAVQSAGLLVTYWFLSGHYDAVVATPLVLVNLLEIAALGIFLRIAIV